VGVTVLAVCGPGRAEEEDRPGEIGWGFRGACTHAQVADACVAAANFVAAAALCFAPGD